MNPPQNAPKWSGGITWSLPREEGGMGHTHLSPPRFFFHRTDFKDSLQKLYFGCFRAVCVSALRRVARAQYVRHVHRRAIRMRFVDRVANIRYSESLT